MISKSLGTTVSGKTVRASRATSRPEVAAREVREREQLTPASRASSAASSAVECVGLLGALPLVLQERRLVDEQVGAARGLERPSRHGAVSPGIDERAARLAPSPSTWSGVTVVPSASVTGSPRWSAPRSGPNGTPSGSAVATSNRPGPVVLDERVADGRDAVLDGERRRAGSRRGRALPGAGARLELVRGR